MTPDDMEKWATSDVIEQFICKSASDLWNEIASDPRE